MIAVTQARGIGRGKDYVAQAEARGTTRTEALRLRRRRQPDMGALRRPGKGSVLRPGGKPQGHGVARACRLLKVSRAAYHQRRKGAPSARRTADAALPAEARRRSVNRLRSEASH